MLQASVPKVLSEFSDACCKCVYLDIAFISHICCKCFIKMFRMFAIISSVFASILDVRFKCFIYLQMYVANVASECFKTRSDVAHVAMHVRNGGAAMTPYVEHKRGVHVRGKRTTARASRCGRPSGRPSASTSVFYHHKMFYKVILPVES
jgi:hypothetical protein